MHAGETYKRFRAAQDGEGHGSLEQLAGEVLLEDLERLTNESMDAVEIVLAMADGDRSDLPLPDLSVMHQVHHPSGNALGAIYRCTITVKYWPRRVAAVSWGSTSFPF